MAIDYGYNLICDWISFTWIPQNDPLFSDSDRDTIDIFFLRFPEFQGKNFVTFEHGGFHYTQRLDLANDLMILYDDKDSIQNKGVYVQVPAHGIPTLFALFNHTTLKDFLVDIYERGCKVSRIDIAFDDFSKTFYPVDFMKYWTNDQIVTHFRRYEFSGGTNGGSMFCLGNRGSNRYLRIYDKEKESDGDICSIRYEFELKGNYANEIAYSYSKSVVFDFCDFINSMFRIVEKSNDSTKCRRNTEYEWEIFLKSQVSRINEIDFVMEYSPVTYERSYNWFVSQCAKTLAKIWYIEGDNWLDELIESSYNQLSPKDFQLVYDVLIYKNYEEKLIKNGKN